MPDPAVVGLPGEEIATRVLARSRLALLQRELVLHEVRLDLPVHAALGRGENVGREILLPRAAHLAVGGDELDRVHPGADRAILERARTRGVAGHHPAQCAEGTARGIRRQAEAVSGRGAVHVTPGDGGAAARRAPVRADHRGFAEALREVHDHAGADVAARHPAPRATGHERRAGLARPPHQAHEVVGARGHGDGGRDDAEEAGALGVEGARGGVGPEDAAKAGRTLHGRKLTAAASA